MNNKIRVALVGPIDTKGRYSGGIASILNTLIASEDLSESILEVIPFDTCRISRDKYSAGGLNLDNVRNAIISAKQLRNILRDKQPDILYFNSSRGYALIKDLLLIAHATKKIQCKTILHIHFANAETIIPAGSIFKKLFLYLLEKTISHIVLLSKNTKEQLETWGIKEKKMSVIYNFHNINVSEAEIYKKASLVNKKNPKDVIFIGSLDERKGILDLLKAIECVSSSVRVHICGEAKQKEIEIQINELIARITGKEIILHGFVTGEEKTNLLLSSDIMILPSYGEGFPLVLLEGLAAGCAIITTDVGAIPEVFSDCNGKIIEPGDIEGIKNAIEQISSSKNLQKIMVENKELSKKYTVSEFISNIEAVCKRVMYES